jgi:probable rRNA maturation factor
VKVLVFNQQDDLPLRLSSVKDVARCILAAQEIKTDEISIYFVTAPVIARIHQEFFGVSSVTDCISFPMDQNEEKGYRILGEIFVCPRAALDFLISKKQCVEEKIYIETTLYLVHGLLHLLGFDDLEEKDRKKMRREEKSMMSLLSQKNIFLKY